MPSANQSGLPASDHCRVRPTDGAVSVCSKPSTDSTPMWRRLTIARSPHLQSERPHSKISARLKKGCQIPLNGFPLRAIGICANVKGISNGHELRWYHPWITPEVDVGQTQPLFSFAELLHALRKGFHVLSQNWKACREGWS